MCVWRSVVYLCRVCVWLQALWERWPLNCAHGAAPQLGLTRGPAELEAPIRQPASRGSLIGVSHPPCVSGRRGRTSWSEPQRQRAGGAGRTRERDQTEQFFLFPLSMFPIFSQPALSAASNPCCDSARWFCLGRRRAEPEKRLWGSGESCPLPSRQGKPCLLLARAASQPCCLQPAVRVPGGRRAAPKLPCGWCLAGSGCAESEVSRMNLFSIA